MLKIDRAFAQTLDGETDTVLLEAIVRLGHSLGIDMIAEGIEHEEQAQTLKRLGCRRAQGFLFHRPLSVSEIPLVVAGSPRLIADIAPPAPAPRTAPVHAASPLASPAPASAPAPRPARAPDLPT